MNSGLLNKDELENNIKHFDYYKDLENTKLKEINKCINDCLMYYKTNNTKLLLDDLENINDNITKILEKRNTYLDILKKVIITYQDTAIKVINNFQNYNKGV